MRYTQDYADLIARYLEKKYHGYQPDAVYVSDDNALSFALSHLTRVFPKTPIFFSGVNNYKIKSKIDNRWVTGVFERKEIVPNLDLLKKISSDMQEIVIIGDASQTYQAIEHDIQEILKGYSSLKTTSISNGQITEILKQLRAINPRYIFMTTLGAITDENGRTLTLDRTINRIVKSGEFIVFSMEDAYLFPGVLGGYVTSGPSQGNSAGELLIRHLNGEPILSLPPIEISPNEYIFDDAELARTGLELPPSVNEVAIRLNLQPTFYDKNRWLIIMSLYVLGGLATIFLLAAVYTNLKATRQLAIREAESHDEILRLNNSLVEIVKSPALTQADIKAFIAQITELVSAAIGVDRVSIWTLEDQGSAIDCIDLWESSGNVHSSGAKLKDAECPSYFQALMTKRTLVFDDVYASEQTQELADEYLPSLGISSMLDAPFFIKGKIAGVLCMEHIGPQRKWTIAEQGFAISITDLISLGFEIETRQQTEDLLMQSKGEAEKANITKSEFLANMSHELRTPLNSIIGFSQMLQSEIFGSLGNEKNKEYAQTIHEAGNHLLGIIGDILDLSKIEAGEEILFEEHVDLRHIISGCMDIMSDRAATKQLSFRANIPDNMPLLHADRLKIMQILLNLLSNAVKFTPAEGEVEVEAVINEQGSSLLKVRDTGIGIRPEDQEKILEPFSQIGEAYTRSHDGTGLGLALVKSLWTCPALVPPQVLI